MVSKRGDGLFPQEKTSRRSGETAKKQAETGAAVHFIVDICK
jgi:hypothetical protein